MNETATPDPFALKLLDAYYRLSSWRKVGTAYGITAAMARMIANGHRPGRRVRKQLGLPETALVVKVAAGDVPPGSQVLAARQCLCGQWFIPNHPRRARCFLCSPYKSKILNPKS